MKFWKINDKAVRCILNFDELREQNIRLEDMMSGTEHAREFLNEIIIQACLELDMKLGGRKLSVHVMPLPDERIDLLISELDDADMVKEDTSGLKEDPLANDLPEYAPASQFPAISSKQIHKKLLFAAYQFSSLEPIIQFSRRIGGNYCRKSSLLKEPVSGIYYLCFYEKRKRFRCITDIANEYGTLYSIEPVILSSIKEHCDLIIKKHAVTYLADL